MAYALFTQSLGADNANFKVQITDAVTGAAATILSSATGGFLNDRGFARLDSSGNLSVYIDTARTWQVSVDDENPTYVTTQVTVQQVKSTTQLAATVGKPGVLYALGVPPYTYHTSDGNSLKPVSGTPVSITGTAIVGGSLVATLASGITAAGYQWLRNGSAISGASGGAVTSSVSYTVVTADRGTTLTIQLSGVSCASPGVSIPALTPLAIFGTPVTAGTAGSSYTGFTVSASGGSTPYVFSLNSSALAAGLVINSASGVVTGTVPAAGTYSGLVASVTDSTSTVVSLNSFSLVSTATLSAPTITTQPSAATVTAGATATFTVVASGTGMTYQWQRNTVNISGATSASFTTPVTTVTGGSANNTDSYRCVVTNGAGSVTSNGAVLTVNAAGVATNPRFGYAPANAAGTASIFDTMFPSMTNLTGSASAGRSGTFNTTSSTTNYTWLAILQSAVSGTGPHVFDGTGFGGFSGALSTGLFGGTDTDPIAEYQVYTDSNSNVWRMYRSDGKATTFSTYTLS
jgi:hypothetical protein